MAGFMPFHIHILYRVGMLSCNKRPVILWSALQHTVIMCPCEFFCHFVCVCCCTPVCIFCKATLSPLKLWHFNVSILNFLFFFSLSATMAWWLTYCQGLKTFHNVALLQHGCHDVSGPFLCATSAVAARQYENLVNQPLHHLLTLPVACWIASMLQEQWL